MIGPASYVVNASDLRTVKPENDLVKYADDTDLVVAEEHVETRFEKELDNISTWANANNLKLNKAVSGDRIQKTEEQEGGTTSTDSRHRPCGGILVSRGNVRQ